MKHTKRENPVAEFRNDETSEAEWMWVLVQSCDDEKRIVFGQLDMFQS